MSSQPYSPAQKRVRYQVSPSCTSTTLTHGHPVPPILMGYRSEGSFIAENPVHCLTGQVTPINMFPDDVLLEIFDLYVGENPGAWRSLVHVCRRWRWLVFASPRRLNVRIVCTHETPVPDLLDVWPAMPILVQAHIYEISPLDNIISVLGHRNRVSGINLWDFAGSHLEKVLGAMKEPFPELVDLHLRTFDRIAPLDPDLFMGGSTPRLRYLQLERIPFPGLPKFLLSATHLVSLRLYDIPHSGYISPEAMVTCLAMLTSLETLCLEFQSLQSHLDCQWGGQRLPLLTRSVLPALVYFHFRGVSEYLEDLMSRVDSSRLNYMSINFAHEIGFDNPQLSQFISRTPALKAPDEAHVIFDNSAGLVTLSSKASGPGQFNVEISCGALERRLSALTQVCNLSMSPLSTVQDLYLCENVGSQLNWDYPMESKEWLELLKPFTSVKNLYLSDGLRQGIAPALRLLIGDRVTEVLPTLESIFLGGPQPSGLYKEGIGLSISPAYPPNFYSQPWDSLGLDHQQNFTAPPPTPQFDWQNLSLDGTQLSGHLQEDIWHDPQNLQLDYLRPSGPLDEDSEQHSSAQSLILYNIYSEESQTSIPFQEGGRPDPQNVNLDWPQPSEPVHEDSQQHSSAAQSSTLQNLYSVDSQPQPSGPFQKGDCPDLPNLHLGWLQPSELFHESFQYSSAQSSIMQNLDSQDSQPTRPLQEGCWPDPQNFHLDGSHWQPSGLFQWEECIGQFVAARQKAAHPITISFWDRK